MSFLRHTCFLAVLAFAGLSCCLSGEVPGEPAAKNIAWAITNATVVGWQIDCIGRQ